MRRATVPIALAASLAALAALLWLALAGRGPGRPAAAPPAVAPGAGAAHGIRTLGGAPLESIVARGSDTPRTAPDAKACTITSTAIRARLAIDVRAEPEGTPVEGVRVVAFPRGKGAAEEDRSDARGRLELAVRPGDALIVALPEGRVPVHERVLGLAANETRAVVLRLPAGASIEGRAIGPRGPIAGAGVRVASAALHAEREAETDGEGRFRLRGLPEGELRLEARAPGFLPLLLERTLRLAPDEAQVGLELEFRGGATLSGTVLRAADRTPVPFALVSARFGDAEPVERRAGIDGTFRLEGLPAAQVRLRAESRGLSPAEVAVQADEGQAHSGLVLLLEPGCAIDGEVVGPDGSPVGRATIVLEWRRAGESPGEARMIPIEADAEGRFAAEELAPGSGVLVVRHPGHPWGRFAVAPLAAGERRSGVRLELARGRTIEGRVVDAGGRPLPGLRIEAWPDGAREKNARGVSDPDGRFMLGGLERGDYEVSAGPRGGGEPYAAARVRLGAGDAVAQVELRVAWTASSSDGTSSQPGGGESVAEVLDGRVEGVVPRGSAATVAGRTVPRGTVVVTRLAPAASDRTVSFTTEAGPDGRFELGGLEPGRYLVAAFGEGEDAIAGPALVEVRAGERAGVDLPGPGR